MIEEYFSHIESIFHHKHTHNEIIASAEPMLSEVLLEIAQRQRRT